MFYDENEEIMKCNDSTGKMSEPTLFCRRYIKLFNV